jgi:hypothetical protein
MSDKAVVLCVHTGAPVFCCSTRDPGEAAELLQNGSSSDKRVGTFDVEFDIEDDVLLNWQHAR